MKYKREGLDLQARGLLGPRPLKYNFFFFRREATQAKKEAESQGDVVQALRRDLAGAAARMSDMSELAINRNRNWNNTRRGY